MYLVIFIHLVFHAFSKWYIYQDTLVTFQSFCESWADEFPSVLVEQFLNQDFQKIPPWKILLFVPIIYSLE